MKLEVDILESGDDLASVADAIGNAPWDEDNEVAGYSEATLRDYLNCQDTVFIVCYLVRDGVRQLGGMASARIETKPYAGGKWLYIDEVDTCSNLRRQGVGTALMRRLFAIASQAACEEVWLGTEVDNVAANRLYQSLDPEDIEAVNGYTYSAGKQQA